MIETRGRTLKAALDAHAHQQLGPFKTAGIAMATAEAYAKTWLKGQAKRAKACECKEIG